MITRAWGTANGYRVMLTREDGDRWKFDVPSLPDGEHIVMELMAENDAGNIGYLATIMLIMTKYHEMKIRVVPRGFQAEAEETDSPYTVTMKERGYHVDNIRVVPRGFQAEAEETDSPYTVTMKERGYHVDNIVCHRDDN